MQSNMGNSTEAQPEENPYKLKKGGQGWEGSSEHFRVRYNVIKIKNTDANPINLPSLEERQWMGDENGNFSHHIPIPFDDSDGLYRLWMDKIGPYLGDWVLGKGRNVSPPWRLIRFPEHYTLWLHKTGNTADPANPRTDAYLHGAPHLGPSNSRSQNLPTIFRSPMEFVEHAIWLMKGGEGQCLCKYCMPGQSQIEINARLDRYRAPDDDNDDDDDDDDGGAGDSRRGRGGGPSSQARRRRRIPRRERPAPIMAKDYRVGNKPSGAA